MKEEKIKNIVKKMNFLDKFGLEIVSNIGDLCLKDQEDKKRNNSHNLENGISINKIN
ncbi:TPA: hypothetical protein ACVT6H_003489 [Clostridioides difficile]|uniref:Uncharacterized protein n=1 Tax=Clostridioides difficile TaxID=1496 RepID=A0AAN6A7D9_CLODI|nr:hypothetical protein [Clostridioides difficile]EIS9623093.1 hypothetical protein [Clostridioides difficile]MCP3279322.1 hypothetical protein [Clostridioides difficile]MCU5837714.1 hypothetical protein [Clostridioides difficile]MDI3117562.1 hypothetical protein [Clostridioides difficile]MDN4814127.1 hypothetical protein [Clostridioides difficile]